MTSTGHIQQLLALSQQLIDLSVAGSDTARDEGCLLLFGIVQDCAWKMRRAAQEELLTHERAAARRRRPGIIHRCACAIPL